MELTRCQRLKLTVGHNQIAKWPLAVRSPRDSWCGTCRPNNIPPSLTCPTVTTYNPTNEDTRTDDQPAQLLSTIVHQLIQQGELDDGEPESSNVPLTQYLPVPLEDLFDPSRHYWGRHHQRTGHRSLDKELEVYNLLDTDLPGEEGAR